MATRRRDVFPGKEKATSSPQTGTAKLKGAVNKITKTNVSTAPKKQSRPTAATDVSKQQVRKPASPATANKPAQARTKPLANKNVDSPKPAQKTRVASVAAAPVPSRSSSFPGKNVASPKPVPGKSVKPVTKDEGKRRLSPPASNARRSSVGLKKKETRTSASATKEQPQITNFTVDKVEDLSMYCVPEPEIQLKDIEYSYLTEAEEKMVQSLSNIGKGSIDILVTEIDQEPTYFPKVGDEIDHADSMAVIAESRPVPEQETPRDTKIQEFENKYNLEESRNKQELEHDTKKTNIGNKVEKLAVNSHEEAGEQEVKEVKVAAEQQDAAAAKHGEAAVVIKTDESKKIERPAVEKKKESLLPPKQQERTHGKIDSPVSNNVIEETASKLLEQKRNKVRALAGAFETVISLQEK